MFVRPFACLVLILFTTAIAQAQTLAERIEGELLTGLDAAATEDTAATLAIVEEFYRARGMQPIWVSEEGVLPRGRDMARLLAAADFDALDPDDYGAGYIASVLGATEPATLAGLEVRLSIGVSQFASDLGQGRTAPNAADPELFLYRVEVDKAAVLSAVAGAADLEGFIDGYRPRSPRYDRIRAALADYRTLAELGGWQPIPDGPALKPGMTDPRIGLIRDRLVLWGDLAAEELPVDADPDFYDDALEVAIKQAQYRHGLTQDGVVGRNTLAALNVPVEDRVEQLVLNLERRRWMPDDLGRRYIFVNLADFALKVVDGEQTIHDTRVVVGLPYHRTPVFSHEITYLVLNPYWHVPPSIARNELLPKIQEDPGYLVANNYTLLSDWSAGATEIDPLTVDWQSVSPDAFHYKIRQEPGDGNALGRVKFMLPNRFNVYLHDTAAKSLFTRDQRSFSHGCIRVMNPTELAALVLAGNLDWDLERINQTIDSGVRTVVSLAEPLPVHISYQTAWVNKDGSVHFRSDIYDRDVVLAEALMGTRSGRTF